MHKKIYPIYYLKIEIRKKTHISHFFSKDDHTRVLLANDDNGDYINASAIVS